MRPRSASRFAMMSSRMPDELTNLLPRERRAAFKRIYAIRIGVIAALAVAALAVAAMILLVPTYVYLAGSAATKTAQLATIDATLSSTNEAALSSRLNALSGNAATLVALAKVPSVSATMRALLGVSRPGITLTGFDYEPATGTVLGELAVTGVAATRDALRSYQLALQGSPFVKTADLPVSSFAKDSNIGFTVTLTLTP